MSNSLFNNSSFTSNLLNPTKVSLILIKLWDTITPIFLILLESDKSLCILDIDKLFTNASINELDISILAIEFSWFIGLTLWGITLDPTSLLFDFS